MGSIGLIVDFDNIAAAVINQSNAAHSKEEIHDILEAYYKVTRKRFVDNVFQQAVNYKLLSGSESPLWLLSEQWVLELNAEELKVIAGENWQPRSGDKNYRRQSAISKQLWRSCTDGVAAQRVWPLWQKDHLGFM